MKIKRQAKIIELIQNNDIETQDGLREFLLKAGFPATQATVSRDIRELSLTKVTKSDGGQKYSAISGSASGFSEKFMRVFGDGVLSLDYAGCMVVVRTLDGMAMAVAACIDAFGYYEIMGCIAGDDTIFCAVRSEAAAVSVVEKLKGMLG
jgi:transcriptional regulator of arginine metabolism